MTAQDLLPLPLNDCNAANAGASANTCAQSPLKSSTRKVTFFLSKVAAIVRHRYVMWHERRMLLALDDATLKDIGISRCDAEREAAKLWRD